MRKTFFKLPLTILACPLLAIMAISGHALGTKETDHQKLTVSQAREQSERQIGRLWLMAMPHLTSEEKDIVTQYLQLGIQRDFDHEKSLAEALEKINNTTLNDSESRSESGSPLNQKERNNVQ